MSLIFDVNIMYLLLLTVLSLFIVDVVCTVDAGLPDLPLSVPESSNLALWRTAWLPNLYLAHWHFSGSSGQFLGTERRSGTFLVSS
ncbi:hypothetical protein PoB_003633900 [Plakobranchus ocellatus]|uniref:Secreted protein n=1 Tax=Plakobranchus ocellatus TaxID=259542 RepID=A0AAV4AU12_9GAST|nr:hypothetical protein PoB_003633900 [Plakobranchus ocellatus]